MAYVAVKSGEHAIQNAEALLQAIRRGDPEFYNRFGFKPARKYCIRSPFDVPDEAFMVKFLTDDPDRYRGKIEYPATFNEV